MSTFITDRSLNFTRNQDNVIESGFQKFGFCLHIPYQLVDLSRRGTIYRVKSLRLLIDTQGFTAKDKVSKAVTYVVLYILRKY
jgi:hypothetical protein